MQAFHHRLVLVLLLTATFGAPVSVGFGQELNAAPRVDFVRDVQPIFREHCFACHASGNEESGLNLAIRARALKGGKSGLVLVAGESAKSLLIQLVEGADPDRRMPPEGSRLSSKQISVLKRWVDQGADWPKDADVLDPKWDRGRHHWAFQRLTKVQPPIDDSGWSKTPIDAFVFARLKAAELEPSKALGPAGFLRRTHFDLIGLPPSRAQIKQFTQAAKVNWDKAVEGLIDRLLDSPHYGERWARHWLDVARYTDSDGQEADRDRPQAYRYRDFIIRSLNDDRAYDQLVRWQIAGDEYQPDNDEAVVATGFLTAGTTTVLADTFLEEERLRNRYNELDDVVSTLGSGMLGMTLGCARCHDHRYDAISARDYYQVLAAFHSGGRQQGKLPSGGQGLFFKDSGKTPAKSWLFERGDFNNKDEQVSLGFPAVLSRGKDAKDYWIQAKSKLKSESTGQRRALAEWLTDIEHGAGGLLARVIVNRVWQHHFGRGLVATSSDFGVRGQRPTHPRLLEWLASDFVDNGWKIKRLHKQIIRSAVYQQNVSTNSAGVKVDPSNRLLWRMRPQRLEAEILRDAMLSISGVLNEKRFGPGFKPPIPAEAIVARNLKDGGYPKNAKESAETRRRSIYMFHKRLVPYPLFQAFDRPDLLQTCAQRENTIVAPQALAILNDTFVRARAKDFALRLIRECGADSPRLVRTAFVLCFSREASPTELESCLRFIEFQTQSRKDRKAEQPRETAVADFCQTLFGLNEFIYVD